MIETGKGVAQNTEYFSNYFSWLENGGVKAVLHYLRHRDISAFDPHNAPKTELLRKAILDSLDSFENYIVAELNRTMPFGEEGLVDVTTVIKRYRSFANNMQPEISIASARSLVGKRFKNLGIKKIVHNGASYYDLSCLDALANSFAQEVGLLVEDLIER